METTTTQATSSTSSTTATQATSSTGAPVYGSLREKIAAEKAARAERYAGFEALWAKAVEAGEQAGRAVTPNPMIVGTAVGLSNEFDLSQPLYYETEGVCGFAWVTVRPGGSSFARWAVAKGIMRKSYSGGVMHWVSGFGQSMQRKEAAAQAIAEVLREGGIKAYAGSRLD